MKYSLLSEAPLIDCKLPDATMTDIPGKHPILSKLALNAKYGDTPCLLPARMNSASSTNIIEGLFLSASLNISEMYLLASSDDLHLKSDAAKR